MQSGTIPFYQGNFHFLIPQSGGSLQPSTYAFFNARHKGIIHQPNQRIEIASFLQIPWKVICIQELRLIRGYFKRLIKIDIKPRLSSSFLMGLENLCCNACLPILLLDIFVNMPPSQNCSNCAFR